MKQVKLSLLFLLTRRARFLPTIAILSVGFLKAQRPFYAAGPLDSPQIAALANAIETGEPAKAVGAFWQEIQKRGTRLVEPVKGNAQYSWVTFLWQAKENTLNVAVIDGVRNA